MMRHVHTLALTGLMSTTAALAQSGTATWQVSADDGATWASQVQLAQAATVRVRILFAWSGIPTAYGFAGSLFDGIIQGASASDSVSDIRRPVPFNFAINLLAATRYTDGIKIDKADDLALPGHGTGWVNPGQTSPDTGPPFFSSSNPAAVFTYSLHVSADQGTRTISNVFPSTGLFALSVYTSDAGAQLRFNPDRVDLNSATITVIPAPSTAAFIALSCLGNRRRR